MEKMNKEKQNMNMTKKARFYIYMTVMKQMKKEKFIVEVQQIMMNMK